MDIVDVSQIAEKFGAIQEMDLLYVVKLTMLLAWRA
jgi:hypothetical protein